MEALLVAWSDPVTSSARATLPRRPEPEGAAVGVLDASGEERAVEREVARHAHGDVVGRALEPGAGRERGGARLGVVAAAHEVFAGGAGLGMMEDEHGLDPVAVDLEDPERHLG